jgi:hypothetical protein
VSRPQALALSGFIFGAGVVLWVHCEGWTSLMGLLLLLWGNNLELATRPGARS